METSVKWITLQKHSKEYSPSACPLQSFGGHNHDLLVCPQHPVWVASGWCVCSPIGTSCVWGSCMSVSPPPWRQLVMRAPCLPRTLVAHQCVMCFLWLPGAPGEITLLFSSSLPHLLYGKAVRGKATMNVLWSWIRDWEVMNVLWDHVVWREGNQAWSDLQETERADGREQYTQNSKLG